MIASFVFGSIRTEVRLRQAHLLEEHVSATYSTYIPYGVRQMADLHWVALLPLRVSKALPRGLDMDGRPDERNQPALIVTATLFVGAFWLVVALWCERLKRSQGPTRAGRAGGTIALAIAAPLLFLSMRSQLTDESSGPRLADAAILPALLLILMSLAQCGWLHSILRRRWLSAVAISALLTCTFLWADREYRRGVDAYESRYRACVAEQNGVCFDFPFRPPPAVQDAAALHFLPEIALELSGDGPVSARK